MVIEARTPRTELVEVGLVPGATAGRLTRGNSNDRQPTHSPDGQRVLLSSHRSGTLDVWALELATRSVRRLTVHPGDDWDPAISPDGRILWSSNRSGHFEIWTAEADGARPRQVPRAPHRHRLQRTDGQRPPRRARPTLHAARRYDGTASRAGGPGPRTLRQLLQLLARWHPRVHRVGRRGLAPDGGARCRDSLTGAARAVLG